MWQNIRSSFSDEGSSSDHRSSLHRGTLIEGTNILIENVSLAASSASKIGLMYNAGKSCLTPTLSTSEQIVHGSVFLISSLQLILIGFLYFDGTDTCMEKNGTLCKILTFSNWILWGIIGLNVIKADIHKKPSEYGPRTHRTRSEPAGQNDSPRSAREGNASTESSPEMEASSTLPEMPSNMTVQTILSARSARSNLSTSTQQNRTRIPFQHPVDTPSEENNASSSIDNYI